MLTSSANATKQEFGASYTLFTLRVGRWLLAGTRVCHSMIGSRNGILTHLFTSVEFVIFIANLEFRSSTRTCVPAASPAQPLEWWKGPCNNFRVESGNEDPSLPESPCPTLCTQCVRCTCTYDTTHCEWLSSNKDLSAQFCTFVRSE